MKKGLWTFLFIGLQCFALTAAAADTTDIRFKYQSERINDKEVLLSVTARIAPGLKLYALQQGEADVLYSAVLFDSAMKKIYSGTMVEKGTKQSAYDSSVSANVYFYTDSVSWQQKVSLAATDSLLSKVQVNYLYKKGEAYLPGEETGKFYTQAAADVSGNTDIADRSLLWIFLTAFGGGLLALLTPCVYSMIPVTVSFFTKRSKTKLEGRKNAVIYSLSIIFIFTFIGFLITLIWGPTALNDISTNWIFNLFIFLVFIIFGISFLGAFEITLPASWSNKADSKANASSFLGIFFMALVLVVVSFSCTGPILGLLLPVIFKGGYAGPLVGFFGFSLALSIPFALFAFFPSWLNSLSKPGGWMNTIKVTLGFIELALALKFLSNADLARGWRLLDREIFIATWIVIFILLGIYLLGKLKFHHDDELPKNDFGIPYLSVPRLLFAATSLVFAVYMIPGLWGAPLKGISAFVPPMGTQDFNADDLPSGFNFSSGVPFTGITNSHGTGGLPEPEKYYEEMRKNEPDVVVNNGMVTYFDYQEALAVSRKLKKPLMLDFTGINCVNCRKMEGQVWSDPKVMERLKNDFVIVSLYVDVHNVYIPQQKQYFSKTLDRTVETLGDLNADMQVSKFGANTQPYYFFLDGSEQRLVPDGYGYDPDINKFIRLLDEVKAAYQKANP